MGKENKKAPLVYLLDCGNAKSSWRLAQAALFNECRQWDRHLFTKDDILALRASLSSTAAGFRTPPEIGIYPDFEFAERYDVSVGIQIGEGCAVHFTPVYGNYGQK